MHSYSCVLRLADRLRVMIVVAGPTLNAEADAEQHNVEERQRNHHAHHIVRGSFREGLGDIVVHQLPGNYRNQCKHKDETGGAQTRTNTTALAIVSATGTRRIDASNQQSQASHNRAESDNLYVSTSTAIRQVAVVVVRANAEAVTVVL